MNLNNLNDIFKNYINKFGYINSAEKQEYYKWQVCHEFPTLMGQALQADDDVFVDALKKAKACTYNIIDSYTQPFSGLVEFAKYEPSTVRNVLKNLYADDGGDIRIQMEKIADFFKQTGDLMDKYFPESFLYKQNSHSVSAMLFLNDPDHHYMYKASQSKSFADCVEFMDEWGVGDNIKLDVYYRMCDELVENIKACKPLMETDQSRFDGRLNIADGELHPDSEKHILAFDLIYCCSVYDLFDGIVFTKRNAKEKQLYQMEKQKANELKAAYVKAQEEANKLNDALALFVGMGKPGDALTHNKYGVGTIDSIDEKYIVATFPEKQAQVSLPVGIANGIIKLENEGFEEKAAEYKDLLKRYSAIPRALEYASKALEPYEEYLD
ncbi:MAG: hypothetical protein J6N21_07810 [Butyrivibrio sp.]|nr:hypothetical protein [Butyrivibrio sp.]